MKHCFFIHFMQGYRNNTYTLMTWDHVQIFWNAVVIGNLGEDNSTLLLSPFLQECYHFEALAIFPYSILTHNI